MNFLILIKKTFFLKLFLIYVFLFFSKSIYANNEFEEYLPNTPKVPLSTKGRFVVDKNGDVVKINGANWYGASGSRKWEHYGFLPYLSMEHHNGLDTHSIPVGLQNESVDNIIKRIKSYGINAIRLPFSNQMIHSKEKVHFDVVKANPELATKTPLEIYNYVVSKLTRSGIMVVLNNHTTYTSWCCSISLDSQWYNPQEFDIKGNKFSIQTEEQWLADWKNMISFHKNNPMVIAADLRNEIGTSWRGGLINTDINNPNYGWNNHDDWWNVSRNAAKELLKINPNILIVIETINWSDSSPIKNLSLGKRFSFDDVKSTIKNVDWKWSNKVVYAIHYYSHLAPKNMNSFKEMNKKDLFSQMDKEFGFLLKENIAPVWITEFGANGDSKDEKEIRWFKYITDYISENNVSFFYWPLMEPISLDRKDNWGLIEILLKDNQPYELKDLLINRKNKDIRYNDWLKILKDKKINKEKNNFEKNIQEEL